MTKIRFRFAKKNMKKLLVLSLLLFNIISFSQEVQKVEVLKNDNQVIELFESLGKNELKLDIAPILAFPALDINYERINDPYSSYGVSLYLNLTSDDSSNVSWTDKFSLTPFYRFYFFNKKDFGGSGFFSEIFSKLGFGKHDVEYYNYNPNNDSPGIDYWEVVEEDYFDIALGAAIGNKWINKKGWTFEISFGVGRFLLNSTEENSSIGRDVNSLKPEAVIRGGLSIGKRF